MQRVDMKLTRTIIGDTFTLGKLYIGGKYFGVTCEDKDRRMEAGGEKVYGKTAIPRGIYRVVVSFSNRFKKQLPLVMDVPGFAGIRFHGGNTADDSEGCILLGKVYVPASAPTGIANCAERMATLTQLLIDAEDTGTEYWLTVE